MKHNANHQNSMHKKTNPLGMPAAWLIVAMTVLGIAGSHSVRAATDIWNGGASPDGNWTTANNWGGIAPVASDTLFFDGSTQLLATNNFTAGTPFASINFNSGASAFTLSGNYVTLPTPSTASYSVGLNAAYADGSISNFSPSAQIINFPLMLTNGHHNIIGNAGGSTLNLAGPVTLATAASAAFDTGVNVTGSGLTNLNGILGGWATMSPPTTWASLDVNSNVVGYTAFTDVAVGGFIVSNPVSNIRISSAGGNVTNAAAGTTDINTLFFTDGGAAETVEVPTNQVLRFGTKGGIFNASRQLGTSRVLSIGSAVSTGFVTAGGPVANNPGDLYLIETPLIGNTGNQLVMNSRITNNGTGAVTVHIFGHISVPSGVNHFYSGGTYINGGRLSASGPTTLGTGPVFVYPGGQLFLNASGTYTNPMFIAGYGNGESAGNGAIRMGGRSISGLVTLMQDAATANGTISGKITGPGGLIVGAGSGSGTGTLTVGSSTGANDYAGDTTINGTNATATSTLQIATGRNNIMPHGAGKGNVNFNGATVVATFDLNGTSQTINGMNFTGAVARAVITSSAAGSPILTVGDGNANGSFGGTIQNGTGIVGLTKIGTGTETLNGVTPYTGNTTVNGGSLVFGLGTSLAGSTNVTVNTNATLNVAAICPVTLTTGKTLTTSNGTLVVALQNPGNAITTSNLTANGSTNFITIAQIPSISSYPAQFPAIKYTSLNGALNFGLAGSLPVSLGTPYAGFISNNVANGSVDFVVTAGPVSIRWAGYDGSALNSAWDIGSTMNWRTLGGGLTTYVDGEFANFDDSASNGVVTISQDVSPAGITVSNSVLTYTNNGAGKLTGGGGLTKQGPGTLILDNSGINDFIGGVTISGGTLQIGNDDTGGNLPAGAVVDNAALVFKHTDVHMVPNVISGTGAVTQNNSNGTLDLTGANTFSGTATVLSGTLRAENNSALGSTNGGTIVSSGATLEIVANAINLGQEQITISGSGVGGNGALVNNSGSTTFVGPNMARLILAGNATVGGSGRFDLRSATTSDSTLGSLSTGGQPYKLTKVGPTGIAFGLIGINVDPALGDVEVQGGILSMEAAVTGLGNPASNIYVWPGATFQMFAATNQVNKRFTLGGDGTATFTVSATSGGGNTIIGPMNITNDCNFNVNNAAVALTLNNVITGSGKITKVGAGTLIIAGNSPNYTGGIQQTAGNVTLNGTMTNTLGVNVAVGKFALNGTLLGPGLTNSSTAVVVGSGTNAGLTDISGTLNPGDTNVVGTLTLGGLNLESTASLNYDLTSKNTPGGGTNDLIVVNGDLVVNGNNVTINPIGLLKRGAGNPYRLFNYTGNLIWNADLSVSCPVNYTFTLDTNTLGQVNLIVSNGPPVWNGGSAADSNWSDKDNWSGVMINSGDTLFFDGTTRLNNTNDAAADTSYTDIDFNTDAGVFILNGNAVALAGNVNNFSTNLQTINLPLDFNTSRTLNGGTGTASLIIGGGVTNTANLTTLTLGGNGTLTNLLGCTDPNSITNIISVVSGANWTLKDNASSMPITMPVQLDVLAGTFNFGSATSAPVLTNTAVNNISRVGVSTNAPGTLNVVNGSLIIASRLNTGAAAGAVANINVSGGMLNPQALLQLSDSSANAYSAVSVTGGTLYVGDASGPNNLFLASRGTGVVSVASSGLIRCATLDMSRNAAGNTLGSVGVFNLNAGGTLSATRIGAATSAAQAGGTPTANFNFNGGTLLAGGSSTTFYQGNASSPAIPIISTVKSGGAIIDTSSNSISILEPLIHDATLGATADGGLSKKGSGTLTMTAASTYTGGTVISNGTLLISGSLGQTAVTVATNGTLAGTGSVGSNVTVNVGGTISPSVVGTIGTFNVASNVVLQGTTAMDINQSTATNDVLKAGGSITYGGTLSVTNLAGTLTGSSTFKLFTAGSYTGAFTSITPAIPQAGLAWNTNTLTTDGILRFVVTVNTTPTNITTVVNGNNLELSWPADHTGWRLQVQTNSLTVGIYTNWVDVAGSASVNSVTNTINANNGSVFYRMIYP
jgi:autotransporter-associated beta strand protein